MIRPPSLQNTFDTFWSKDPAFQQPPAKATDAELAEHARKVKVARETGDWSALRIAGMEPTKFVCRNLSGDAFRRLVDKVTAGEIGSAQMPSVAFRIALDSIENLDGHKVKRVNSEDFGPMASVDTTNLLDAVDFGIVAEIGSDIIRRAQSLSPL